MKTSSNRTEFEHLASLSTTTFIDARSCRSPLLLIMDVILCMALATCAPVNDLVVSRLLELDVELSISFVIKAFRFVAVLFAPAFCVRPTALYIWLMTAFFINGSFEFKSTLLHSIV